MKPSLRTVGPVGIGLDPGFKNGAAAIIEPGKMPVWFHVQPLSRKIDMNGVMLWLESHLGPSDTWDRAGLIVGIEKVGPFKGQGLGSTWKFAMSYGQMTDRLDSLGVKYHNPTPQQWKATQLEGMNRSEKSSSIERVQQLYPGIELRRPGENGKIRGNTKPWDGAAEAILIARHAILKETQ